MLRIVSSVSRPTAAGRLGKAAVSSTLGEFFVEGVLWEKHDL